MKTAIVLAGRHEPTDERYKKVIKAFEEAGWEQVIFYVPDWKRHTITDLVDDFLRSIPKDAQSLTLLGFSLGGLIALVASSKVVVDNLILCSPSGYFKEYEALLTPDDLKWAHKHASDFEQHSAKSSTGAAKVEHGYIIAGSNEISEWPDFKQWITDLKQETGWSYTELSHTGHEIESSIYQSAIKTLIQNLN